MTPPAKVSRKVLSIREKYNVLSFHTANPSMSTRKLANKFDCGKTQIQYLLKNKHQIIQEYESNTAAERKRSTNLNLLDDNVYNWFVSIRAKHVPVSGPLVQEKALAVATEIGLTDFKASNGWLDRWKQRHNIKEFSVSGESGDVSLVTIESWKEVLRELIKDFELKDIYNLDETGLFFKSLPNKTLSEKGKETKGGKGSKIRITLALFCNAIGEKEEPVIIGKSAKPRCFQGLKRTDKINGVRYFHDKKSWMQIPIMKHILNEFNKKMQQQNRNVLLLLDNAPVHPPELKNMYSNLKIVFLPKNTTSKLQPLDAGIIKNLKVHYRKLLLQHIIARIDDNLSATEIANSINVLHAIYWIKQAWQNVLVTSISNCFKVCGIDNTMREALEDDDPFNNSQELNIMKELLGKLQLEDPITPEEFVDVDSQLSICISPEVQSIISVDLLHENDENEEDEDEIIELESVQTKCAILSYSAALTSAQDTWNFLVTQGETLLAAKQLEVVQGIERAKIFKPKTQQSTLETYFYKNK